MLCLEIIAEVHAYESIKSIADSSKKTKIVLCHGEYLYLKSKLITRRSIEENIQVNK